MLKRFKKNLKDIFKFNIATPCLPFILTMNSFDHILQWKTDKLENSNGCNNSTSTIKLYSYCSDSKRDKMSTETLFVHLINFKKALLNVKKFCIVKKNTNNGITLFPQCFLLLFPHFLLHNCCCSSSFKLLTVNGCE